MKLIQWSIPQANTLPQLEDSVNDTLGDMKAERTVDTLADMQAEIKAETLGDTLANVKCRGTS